MSKAQEKSTLLRQTHVNDISANRRIIAVGDTKLILLYALNTPYIDDSDLFLQDVWF